jgi:hypothetical protein
MNNPSPTEYIMTLARSFPCLEPKLRWWKPASFDANDFHAIIGGWSTSEYHAALLPGKRAGRLMSLTRFHRSIT